MPQQYSFITVADVLDTAKAEAIGSTTSALTALQDTQLIEKIEQINSTFIENAHTRHHYGGWSWMEKVKPFKTVAATTLNGAISAGDATLILTSASDFDSSGRIVIESSDNALDFVDYESKATNTLTVSTTTGDDVIDIDHTTGSAVDKLYALPSDYGKTRKLIVGSTEYFYQRIDQFPTPRYYTTVDNYIMFSQNINAQDVTHYYEKKGATLTATTDTTDIPANFQRYAIESLKAHIFMIRRKRNDITLALQLADQELERALNYDSAFTTPKGLRVNY